jgi:fatty-acyl-CoA synthase
VATIERVEEEFGWEITQLYGLTGTAPFITVCETLPEHKLMSKEERAIIKARQGVELITSGELSVFDSNGKEVSHDGTNTGQTVVRGNVVMKGYFQDPEATSRVMQDGWFPTLRKNRPAISKQ